MIFVQRDLGGSDDRFGAFSELTVPYNFPQHGQRIAGSHPIFSLIVLEEVWTVVGLLKAKPKAKHSMKKVCFRHFSPYLVQQDIRS